MSSAVYAISDWRPLRQDQYERVKQLLIDKLRASDEAYLLPGAHQDDQALRNIILALDPDAPPEKTIQLLSPQWAHGVAIVRLGNAAAEALLSTSQRRQNSLKILSDCVANELTSSKTSVGPQLKAEGNHDLTEDDWECGFDSEQCCAGLYFAMEDRAPSKHGRVARLGTTRGHPAHYLVVRAGAGKAAEEFHGRLIDHMSRGKSLHASLDSIASELSSEGGVDGMLKRLTSAGRRNRARIMLKIGHALGISADMMTALDHGANAAHGTKQMAALDVDTVTNVLERNGVANGDSARANYYAYYASTTAPKSSQGVVVCSNIAEGFVLFRPTVGTGNDATEASINRAGSTMRINNNTYGSIPFTSEALHPDSEIFQLVENAYVSQIERDGPASCQTKIEKHGQVAGLAPSDLPLQRIPSNAASGVRSLHTDADWIDQHFTWHTASSAVRRRAATNDNSTLTEIVARIEPPALWGTHAPLGYNNWGHTMAIHELSHLRLRPELVLMAGCEMSKLRGTARTIAGAFERETPTLQ